MQEKLEKYHFFLSKEQKIELKKQKIQKDFCRNVS